MIEKIEKIDIIDMGNCSFMAGIVRLEMVPSWGISRLRRAGGMVNVTLEDGVEWRRVYCVTAEYDEAANDDDAKTRTLKCRVPIGEGGSVLAEIEALTQDRWVAKVTDGRGVQWIVGDDQEPLVLTWSRTNEGEAAGKDEIELKWSGEGRWGAMELRIEN